MKKAKKIKSFGVIVITLTSLFLLFTNTYGADSNDPNTTNISKNQVLRIPKTANKQFSGERPKTVKRQTLSPSSFKPDMPFSEAIDILRNSTVPPLNIVVLWKDIEENADIYKDTPIGMDGLSGVPLRTHLKVLLMSVSAGAIERLRYTVDDGVIIIATQGSLPRKMVTRIYDVTDLVSEPANYRFMPGFGMPFGFGGMAMGGMMPFGGGFGGMMSFGSAGLGGMMPFGGAGFGGQGLLNSPNMGTYGGISGTRLRR